MTGSVRLSLRIRVGVQHHLFPVCCAGDRSQPARSDPVRRRFPRGIFDYLVGVGRWTNRVTAYAFILVTDEYPPFRLGP
jgi:hypothetical protein